jgi:hypothetical protein
LEQRTRNGKLSVLRERVFEGLRRVKRSADEAGQAMLVVLAALVLLASVPVVVITTTDNQLPLTTNNVNWNGAYEAAQAGLNDYLQHLDANSTYTQYTRSNPDSGNPALLAAGVTPSSSPSEKYWYSPAVATGKVTLTVTGEAGTGTQKAIRTFVFTVHPASTLNYLYWSNYETTDPVLQSDCIKAYYDQPGYTQPGDCYIYFYHNDELYGPTFSDDTFQVQCNGSAGPIFDNTVQSGNEYTSTVWVPSGCSSSPNYPDFGDGAPTHTAYQAPQSSIVDEVPAQNFGCYIAGSGNNPTNITIVLNGTTLTWSGSGTVQNSSSNTNTSGSNDYCGGSSDGPGTITISNLRSALIYVNGNVSISGTLSGFLTIVAGGTVGNVVDGDIAITGNITYPPGDIQTCTIGSHPNEPCTDFSDALGLLAQSFISVCNTSNSSYSYTVSGNPWTPCNGEPTSGTAVNTIDAAMLAFGDSFFVPDWGGIPDEGNLNVFGTIAQEFRGPIGNTGGAGYSKQYLYDQSLETLWPPYFILPAGATWSPQTYGELAPGCAASVPGPGNC